MMQQILLISCVFFLADSSAKLRHKTREVLHLAKKYVLHSNYEAAIQSYETAYKITSMKDLLFDIAMAKTLVKPKKEAIHDWKIFLQEYGVEKKRKDLWQHLAECIMTILITSKKQEASTPPSSLEIEKKRFIGYIKRIYMGKGYLFCKQLVEFGTCHLEFSIEEKWWLNKIYADCLYQLGLYEQACKLYRNIYIGLKNQEFLLDESRCFFRNKQYKKGLKSILSISDKVVMEKITYHTTLISLYVKMGKVQKAKTIYKKAKSRFTGADQKKRLQLVARSNQLDS